MFCQKCGSPLKETDRFCSGCGSPVAVGKKSKFSPAVVAVLCLAFCLLGAGGVYLFLDNRDTPASLGDSAPANQGAPDSGALDEVLFSQRTWEDPDELVTAYLQALKRADVDGVLELCDIPEQLEYMDWEEYLNLYIAIIPGMYVPPYDQATSRLAESKLESDITERLFSVWSGVFAGRSEVAEAIASGIAAAYDRDSGGAEEFVRLFTEEHFTQMDYAACRSDLSDREDMIPRALANTERMYQGAVTDYMEYLVLLSFDGSYSAHGITLYQYGDGWKIHSLSAPLSGISTYGEYLSDLEGMTMSQVEALAFGQYGLSEESVLYP